MGLPDNPTKTEVAEDFADSTSAHGFASVLRAGYSFLRIIWIIAIAAAWITCGYFIVQTIISFLNYETNVNLRITQSTDVSFPSVTLCNLNPIRKSFLESSSTFETFMKKQEALENTEETSWDDMSEEQEMTLTPEEQLKFMVNVSNAGHQLSEMMIDCVFQGRQCSITNFTKWQHSLYGNCYTMFISGGDYTVFIGPNYGLSLTLDVQDNEYLDMTSPATGFRVQIHPSQYVPFPDDFGFSVSPQVETAIAVTQTFINRQPLPYDSTDCGVQPSVKTGQFDKTSVYAIFNEWVVQNLTTLNFTYQSCLKNCFVKQMMANCKCVDSTTVTHEQMTDHFQRNNVPKEKQPIACDLSEQEVLMCVRNLTTVIVSGGLCQETEDGQDDSGELCSQPCSQQIYQPRVTMSMWPRSQYLKLKMGKWQQRQKNIANMGENDMKLVKILVYFEELNYEAITESPVWSVASLLSSIGGTLGLYCGMSFLTILEFIELFTRWCRARGNHHTPREQPMSASSHTHVNAIGPNSYYVPK